MCYMILTYLVYGMLTMPRTVLGSPNTIMALAGNKADLLESRQVSAEASLFHHHFYFISYYNTFC